MQVPTGDSAVSNLADFLGTQDSENIVLIGTEPGEGTVCGILAASGAVDALTLLEHYDLLAYDGLLPPEIFETLYQRAEVHVLEQRQKEADETYARLVVRISLCAPRCILSRKWRTHPSSNRFNMCRRKPGLQH
jgi:hypothetical protein